MNYINPKSVVSQYLYLNTKAEVTDEITWTIKKEGSDTIVASFISNAEYDYLTDHSYYQKLMINLYVFNISLTNDTWYTLTGTTAEEVVYRGKLLATDQVDGTISINKDKYVQNHTDKDYIILQ